MALITASNACMESNQGIEFEREFGGWFLFLHGLFLEYDKPAKKTGMHLLSWLVGAGVSAKGK